jgi:membrane associated rhomboid family serine protease
MSEDESATARDHGADVRRLQRAFVAAMAFAAVLWVVKGIEWLTGISLVPFGIYPGRIDSLGGIVLAPFIHGSWAHLFANTAPLVILGTAMLYGYPRASRVGIPALFLGTGLGVWLFARGSYHIGASGLTFGMMFFVFTIGVLRRDPRAVALSLLVFFLYGGMIWGIFPGEPGISYESHFFGMLTGVVLAFALRKRDPPPPRKQYSWETEDEEVLEDWPPRNSESR